MSKAIKIAVVGANTLDAEVLIESLVESDIVISELIPLALAAEGDDVAYGNRTLPVKELDGFDFGSVDLVFLCEKDDALAALCLKSDCLVVSLGDELHAAPYLPGRKEAGQVSGRLLEVPSGMAGVVCKVVDAILEVDSGIRLSNLDLTAVLSVSNFGRKGVDALAGETAKLLNGRPIENDTFAHQVAFNVLPRLPLNQDEQVAKELLLEQELDKLLDGASAVTSLMMAPVFYGDTAVLKLELNKEVDLTELKDALDDLEGIEVLDDPDEDGFPSPVKDAVNSDTVYLTRFRQNEKQSVMLVNIVAETMRFRMCSGAISAAKILIKQYL